MATEVHKFGVTIPPGTLPSAPQVSNLNMPARAIVRVMVVTPPGTHGLVGWALGAAGRAFIPYEPGAFIISDGEVIDWELEGGLTSGGWQLFAYNTGTFPHTLEIRFLANLVLSTGPDSPALLPAAALAPSSGAGVDLSGTALPPLPPLPPPPPLPPLPPGLDGAPPLDPFGPPARGRPHPVGGSVGPLLP